MNKARDIRFNVLSKCLMAELDYMINRSPSSDVFYFKVQSAEQFGKNLKLPLKVKGVFLFEGKPAGVYYPAEELEKAARDPRNANFPLMLDHKDDEVGQIVGKVNKIQYNSVTKGIEWWGHVNDETQARNIIDGLVTEVSVTVYSAEKRIDKELGPIGINLLFTELSLVMEGSVKGNKIEVA